LQHKLNTSLKSSCPTRWNSNYAMLKSIDDNWVAVYNILSEKGAERLMDVNRSTLKMLVGLLESFENFKNFKLAARLQFVLCCLQLQKCAMRAKYIRHLINCNIKRNNKNKSCWHMDSKFDHMAQGGVFFVSPGCTYAGYRPGRH